MVMAKWSGRRELNPRSPAPRAGALPLRHAQMFGGECRNRTYKPLRLPLSGRLESPISKTLRGGPDRNRTCVSCLEGRGSAIKPLTHGALGRTRTSDPLVTKEPLYQTELQGFGRAGG